MEQLQSVKRMKKAGFIISALFFAVIFTLTANQSNAQSTKAKPWIAAPSVNQVKNPQAVNASTLKESKRVYLAYCAPCHGNSGKGNGIAAASVNPKPADHTSAAVQSETDGSLYWKMTEGRTPMPSYKQILTDVQRWQMVNYIRTLAKSK